MAYPHKWSPISYKSSAGQRKHIGQRPMLYRWTTPSTVRGGHSLLGGWDIRLECPIPTSIKQTHSRLNFGKEFKSFVSDLDTSFRLSPVNVTLYRAAQPM